MFIYYLRVGMLQQKQLESILKGSVLTKPGTKML